MKPELRNKDTGNCLERYGKSFLHAIDGIVYALKNEHNMIIIAVCALITVVLGFIYNLSLPEWLFVISMIGLVAACEMLNTALEASVDLVTLKMHQLAKIAKDSASSATLILSLTALVGGLIIFVPKILNLG